MNEFIAKFGDQITGVLSGFDRLVPRGSLRAICYEQGMEGYLSGSQVLLKDSARHVLSGDLFRFCRATETSRSLSTDSARVVVEVAGGGRAKAC